MWGGFAIPATITAAVLTAAWALGPRSLALLRRICFALETLVEERVPDLGRTYEDPEETWPEEVDA